MVAFNPYHWLIAAHLISYYPTRAEQGSNTNGQCPPSISSNLVSCDSQTGDWLVRNANWIGMIDSTLVVANCPPEYCFYNTSAAYVRVPQNITSDPEEVLCRPEGRRGYICGECQLGWAPAVNSYPVVCVRCEDDTKGWLYYLLAIYVPVFAFFMIIIIFNFRFTSGPANAFILYAQLISTTFNQLYKPIDSYQRAYRTVYGVFNLQFIASLVPPFCVGKSLDSLNVIALKYLEAVFPLFMIFGILVFFRCQMYIHFKLPCSRCKGGVRMANSLAHALETVENRPYFAGQHRFTDISYIIPNIIPACVALVTFIAIPPILLLDYPMRWMESGILKSPTLARVYPKVGVSIVLDTFQGCFHDDKRYFAGLYFVLRLLLFVTYFAPLLLQYILQQVLVTVFAVFLSVQKPYKRRSLNYLDSLLLLNMAIINILGIYSLATDQLTPSASSTSTLTSVFILQYILIWLPIAYMIVYLCKVSKFGKSCVIRDSTVLEDNNPESKIERSTLYVMIDDDPK